MFGRTFARTYSSPANPTILSTLLLLRPPIVTADLPEFQKLYYRYQNELWKRLMWTFPKWFYYREGTLSEQKFRELNKNPIYNNPNLEFPRGRPELRQQRDRRFKQELSLPKTYAEGADEEQLKDSMSRKVIPNSRITKADEANDTTSLERKLARTLYLVVSEDNGTTWRFPSFANTGKPLHQEAEEGLYAIGGDQINYFNVSAKPFHVHHGDKGSEFFIKLHILSGQFTSKQGLKHAWLTSEEVGERLKSEYFGEIRHLMSDV